MEHSTAQYCTLLHNTAILHSTRCATYNSPTSNSTAQYISVHSRYTIALQIHQLQSYYSPTTDYRSHCRLALPTPYLDRAIATRTKESSPSPCQFLNSQIPQLLLYSYVWACLSIPPIVYARVNKILSPIDTERASQLARNAQGDLLPALYFLCLTLSSKGHLVDQPRIHPRLLQYPRQTIRLQQSSSCRIIHHELD